MKYLFINAVCGIKSTGRICAEIGEQLEASGNEVKIAYGRGIAPEKYNRFAVKIGNKFDVLWHAFMGKYFYQRGLWSRNATKKFLKWADQYDPDILWLHNIHDYFINIEYLFRWIKSRPQMKVIWTHHDCWAFTGGCCYFSFPKCDGWKDGCKSCCKYKGRIFDNNRILGNYKQKVKLFAGISNMKMITPSYWLAELIKQSFLKTYPIEVHHNMIDTTVFKPTTGNFREKYQIKKKFVIVGVASPWSERKGLPDFITLSQRLDDSYVVILVGVNKKQIKKLPSNVIGILHTDSVEQLAEIYTSADLFLNLTYEDNYPTTNLEAQACGTPAITYRTGGSPESVPDKNVVEQGDIETLITKINSRDYEDAIDISLFKH